MTKRLEKDVQIYRASWIEGVGAAVGVLFVGVGLSIAVAGSSGLGACFVGIGLLCAWACASLLTARLRADATGIVRRPGLLIRGAFTATWSEIESFQVVHDEGVIRAVDLRIIGQGQSIRITDAELSNVGVDRFLQLLREHEVEQKQED